MGSSGAKVRLLFEIGKLFEEKSTAKLKIVTKNLEIVGEMPIFASENNKASDNFENFLARTYVNSKTATIVPVRTREKVI